MKYNTMIQTFRQRPYFETVDLLIQSGENESLLLPQLSRWVKKGQLVQLRRGKYLLPDAVSAASAHPFFIANCLHRPSYISLFTALQHYLMVPEQVHQIQSVSTRQTAFWNTAAGMMRYYSTQVFRFFGYEQIRLGEGSQQLAYIAHPEKALIDLAYYQQGEWTAARWQSLRLQNTSILDKNRLLDYAEEMKSPKIQKSIAAFLEILEADR